MKADGCLVEVHPASGGHWGSTTVNIEFSDMLSMLYGKYIDLVRSSDLWFSVMDSFEAVKLRFQGAQSAPLLKNINLSSLGDADVTRIACYNVPGSTIQFTSGILRIPAPTIEKFFQPSISKITTHIKELLEKDVCRAVKHILLVGGFAESPVLVKAIKESMAERAKVICPPRPGCAVLIGAVQYGLDPHSISSRIGIRTLCVINCLKWDDKLHSGRIQETRQDGLKMCGEAVNTFFSAGQQVKENAAQTQSFLPMTAAQPTMEWEIYESNKPVVMFRNDPGNRKIGKLRVILPPETMAKPWTKRDATITVNYGGPVFTITAQCDSEVVLGTFSFSLDDDTAVV